MPRTSKAAKAAAVTEAEESADDLEDDAVEPSTELAAQVNLEAGAINVLQMAPEMVPEVPDFERFNLRNDFVFNRRNPLRWSQDGREAPPGEVRGKPAYDAKSLRNMAHKAGLVKVESELIHINIQEQFAIVRATVYFSDGTSFQAIGDADPESVGNANIALHYVRMAETRALTRAFTVALNADANAIEEFTQESHSESKTTTSYRSKGKSSGKANGFKAKGKAAKKSESSEDDDWD